MARIAPSKSSSTNDTCPESSRAPTSSAQPATMFARVKLHTSGVHGEGIPTSIVVQKRLALSSGKSICPNGARFAPLLMIWMVRVPMTRDAPRLSVTRTASW